MPISPHPTTCPECESDNLYRRIGLLPECPTCEWTGWSKDTEQSITQRYDFSLEDA